MSRADLLRLTTALAIGTVGGALFFALNMPLAWMIRTQTKRSMSLRILGSRRTTCPSKPLQACHGMHRNKTNIGLSSLRAWATAFSRSL